MATSSTGVSWREKLKRYVAQEGGREVVKKVREEAVSQDGDTQQQQQQQSGLPRFYSKPPAEDQVLLQKLRAESRAVFLQHKSSGLMDNDDLQRLWGVLEEKYTPPLVGEDQMISFTDFMSLQEHTSDKCQCFFTAKVFAKLIKDDPYGRVSVSQLFSYIMRKVWLQQTRIGLSLFDMKGHGYITEPYLEKYILDLIPTLPQLAYLEESFYAFYICTAVRKFFFFLDPPRSGRIRIQDILMCGFLDDLLELRDAEMSSEEQESNWFSAQSALRVYGQYLSLDSDHNGMLSKQELARFGTGTLTEVFIDRVFQECLTYDGEVDYKTYLDFVLAMEHRGEPQSLQYLFRLLDIDGKGYLDGFTLKYYFRAIQDRISSLGHEEIKFEDIKDEIFDMVKPRDPHFITLQDLINSGQGETVINILTDTHGFWAYENRESLITD